MRMTTETRATRRVLRTIVQRDFAGSQADFSAQCGLDSADTSRVISGIRPVTPGLIRRASGALGKKSAIALISAFLSDVARGVTGDFSVRVVITPKAGLSRPSIADASIVTPRPDTVDRL